MELLMETAKEMLHDAEADGDNLRIGYALRHLAFLDDMARLATWVER